jgi:hypothetical protein
MRSTWNRKWILEVKDGNEWHKANVAEAYDHAWEALKKLKETYPERCVNSQRYGVYDYLLASVREEDKSL